MEQTIHQLTSKSSLPVALACCALVLTACGSDAEPKGENGGIDVTLDAGSDDSGTSGEVGGNNAGQTDASLTDASPDGSLDMGMDSGSPDPCDGWPEPNFIDVNCGPAPLTVTYDVTGALNEFEQVDRITFTFGDGESQSTFDDPTATHVYSEGDWEAETEIVGDISGTGVTITTPERIRAY